MNKDLKSKRNKKQVEITVTHYVNSVRIPWEMLPKINIGNPTIDRLIEIANEETQ